MGFTNIESIRDGHSNLLDKADIGLDRLKYGITYYEDLAEPVTSDEAHQIFEMIKKHVLNINQDFIVSLVGGFRRLVLFSKFIEFIRGFAQLIFLLRGKTSGHDIDILVTHPIHGEEGSLLDKLIEKLGKSVGFHIATMDRHKFH
jgi:hypothetical protein